MQFMTNTQIIQAKEMMLTLGLDVVAKHFEVRQGTIARYLPEEADLARTRNKPRTSKPKGTYLSKAQMVHMLRYGTGLALPNLEKADYDSVKQVFNNIAKNYNY